MGGKHLHNENARGSEENLYSLKSRYLMRSSMFAVSSLLESFLSQVDLFLMCCRLTAFLARLLRLLGEVWVRRLR